MPLFLDSSGTAGLRDQAGGGERGPGDHRYCQARRPGVLHFQRRRPTLADLRYHIATILSGLYSLAGQPDLAIIEQRIVRHGVFEKVSAGGTPDIRVVLYRCVPVMAMVRLPTQASRGGRTCTRARPRRASTSAAAAPSAASAWTAPSPFIPIRATRSRASESPSGMTCWQAAMKLADGLDLGYIGVDFVVDADRGPVVLEANARPGLNIQVANRRGLGPRLDYLNRLPEDVSTARMRGLD